MDKPEREFELERIVFFSDAVFAIAITLLALTLVVPELPPHATDSEFVSAVLSQGSQFLAFLISFAVIGEYWIAHHRIFTTLFRWDLGLLSVNLGFLLTVVILPWPTEMIARYGNLPSATAIYALAVAACGVMLSVVWVYARYRGLMAEMTRRAYVDGLLRTLASPIVFLLSIPVAYASPTLAKLVWILLLPINLALDVRLGKAEGAHR